MSIFARKQGGPSRPPKVCKTEFPNFLFIVPGILVACTEIQAATDPFSRTTWTFNVELDVQIIPPPALVEFAWLGPFAGQVWSEANPSVTQQLLSEFSSPGAAMAQLILDGNPSGTFAIRLRLHAKGG